MWTRSGSLVLLTVIVAACGGGSNSPTSSTPTLASLSISPATDMIRIKGNESFTVRANYSDGTSSVVQAVWGSDATAVATVDATGRTSGVTSGAATIFADYQGMRATRLLRVVPDYHGRWDGDWQTTTCTASGDWAGACEDAFLSGELYGLTLVATQARDTITGTVDFGDDLPGQVTGTILSNGHLTIGSTYTVNFEGLPVQITLSEWDTTTTDNQTLTGRFRITFRFAGLNGALEVSGELRVVTKTSSTPASLGGVPSSGGLLRKVAPAKR